MNLSATHAVSVNPATGERVSSLPWASEQEVDSAIALAEQGYRQWRHVSLEQRADALRKVGNALRARAEEMAQMISLEMGKPIAQARGEVTKSANLCDWYAEHGPAMLATEATQVENNNAVIEYRPLGAILAIMPWNFPLWQVLRGAVPILLAGNAEAFSKKFVAAVEALKMGDPRDEANYLGPMARFDLRDELHQQVTATLAEGATLLLGAEKIAGQGNYYAPTVLGNVTPEMTGFRQELFGPVATITVARDAAHALTLANDSEFGLSATVFTASVDEAGRFSRELECGGVFINGYSASDARVAFGGVKKSGFGRELSHFGLHEFCNVQTVWKDRR